jgi:hypothetical protein
MPQVWSVQPSGSGNTSVIRLASGGGVLDGYECSVLDGSAVYVYPNDNGTGTCGGRNQQWSLNGDGTIVNAFSSKCLDVYDFAGPAVDTWSCNGACRGATYGRTRVSVCVRVCV